MKISKNKIWKITSFILTILFIFVLRNYYLEYTKNRPQKEELASLKKFLERTQKESFNLQKGVSSLSHPLEEEKIKKDKFGESLEGEKVILISDDLLNSIELPFLR